MLIAMVRKRKMAKLILLASALALLVIPTAKIARAQSASSGDIEVLQVRPDFYMIAGAGGNIAVQLGPDGVVVVNTGSAEMADRVLAAIKKLSSKPIRYIIDTSADADMVGGNERLSKAGQSFTLNAGAGDDLGGSVAVIVGTENVLNRMSAPTGKQSAFPVAAWPTETFFEKEKPMYMNREGIQIIAQPAAHTDGDSIVFFRRSDVVVAGDILDTDHFPVIDIEKGGGIQGEIAALNRLVEIAIPSIPLIWQEGGTYVIPGHGWLCDQPDVVAYRDMITMIRDRVQNGIEKGMTLAQIQDADPTKGFKQYGSESGPWTTKMFVEAIYKSLTAKK
jgi:glyoxylase-like metal-dependent hydrolase (beta-lactamase superfamily II)